MTQDEALKLALEALEDYVDEYGPWSDDSGAQYVLRVGKEALAQPEQEPVAYATKEDFHRELERRLKHIREEMKIKSVTMRCKDYDIALPIIDTHFGRVLVGQVFAPPQRTWVGLTDEEVSKLIDNEIGFNSCCGWEEEYTRAVEAKLKEKNHD